MIDELLSLRVVAVSPSAEYHDLCRQAASALSIPVEFVAADEATSVVRCLADGVDILYVDGDLAPPEIAQIVTASRAARARPFSILLSDFAGIEPFATDALAGRPAQLEDVRRLVEHSIRVRLPSRVLVVDDSSTMRGIVRRLLDGTGFPLDVIEVEEGFAALDLVRKNAIDLVFMDYNMPGFSGLETLAEIRREKRRVYAVIMTSVDDDSLADRAREQGAAFLRKPFFPADIEAVLCRFYGLRALNPKRD
jgi:CheY-like chemotaxis protein